MEETQANMLPKEDFRRMLDRIREFKLGKTGICGVIVYVFLNSNIIFRICSKLWCKNIIYFKY